MLTFLDTDLRERWVDEATGRESLEAARRDYAQRVAADDGEPVARSNVGRAAQRLSESMRLCGEFEQALVFKKIAIDIWVEQDKAHATFLVRLQRALVLAECGRSDEAAQQMGELADRMDADEKLGSFYRDFWLQYEARRLVCVGDRERAAERLTEALEFRAAHRASKIVKWTQEALERLYSEGEH